MERLRFGFASRTARTVEIASSLSFGDLGDGIGTTFTDAGISRPAVPHVSPNSARVAGMDAGTVTPHGGVAPARGRCTNYGGQKTSRESPKYFRAGSQTVCCRRIERPVAARAAPPLVPQRLERQCSAIDALHGRRQCATAGGERSCLGIRLALSSAEANQAVVHFDVVADLNWTEPG